MRKDDLSCGGQESFHGEDDKLDLKGQAVFCAVQGAGCVSMGSWSFISCCKVAWARSEVWISWVEDAIRKIARRGLQRLSMLSRKRGHSL